MFLGTHYALLKFIIKIKGKHEIFHQSSNYNIFIYPLYDCNLYELHQNYFDQFTEEIVADIIDQCFIRIGPSKKIIKSAW